MAFAVTEDAISCLKEGVRGLADTWQDTSGYGAGIWGAEVCTLNDGGMHDDNGGLRQREDLTHLLFLDRLCFLRDVM